MNDKDIVSAVRSLLAEKIGLDRCELWFGATTRFTLLAGTLLIEAANQFAQDWLRSHYRQTVEAVACEVLGTAVAVEFRVDESLAERGLPCGAEVKESSTPPCRQREHDTGGSHGGAGRGEAGRVVNGKHTVVGAAPALHRADPPRSDTPRANNSRNASDTAPRRRFATLGTFVVGSSNRLAHASAQMVAEKLGSLTPLVVHGPHGTGKTHLLEGIWSAVRAGGRGGNAVYLSAEQFTTYFVEAVRGSGLPNFRRKYRGVDVLLVDDLQFLAGKRATLVELLHTIDALSREGRQLVFSADRPPSDLPGLGPELTTRLSGGMVCAMEQPDLQTRSGLVHEFARRLEISLPETVAQLVAGQLAAGGRELAGAVHRLHAASRMLGQPIDQVFAQETLAEMLRGNGRAVRLVDIEQAVCDVFGLPKESLQSNQRTKTISAPRMLAMWLARKYTRAGLSEIGQYFGRRSHSTVISAQKRVTDWVANQSQVDISDSRCQIGEALRRVEAQLRVG